MIALPHDPGLRIHHDIRNERWLLRDALPIRRMITAAVGVAAPVVPPFTPKTVHHRQHRRYNQGPTPQCTGFGPITLCAAAHPFNPPPLSGEEWYALNRKRDHEQGLDFDEGATVTSSLEVGRQLGIFSAYRWAYEIETMQRAILAGPLIAGTFWYDSMFERDAEAIVRVPGVNERTDAGHEYVLGAYDAHRDLWDVEQTWEPTPEEATTLPYGGWVYRIPGDLMHRLLREEGEVAQIDEVKLAA